MNYEYTVILNNGVNFYATSKDMLWKIKRAMVNDGVVEFDNAVVPAASIAAVTTFPSTKIEWPT